MGWRSDWVGGLTGLEVSQGWRSDWVGGLTGLEV